VVDKAALAVEVVEVPTDIAVELAASMQMQRQEHQIQVAAVVVPTLRILARERVVLE